ncbi:hypothetical protein C8R47DRAFT_1076792 [Mycena vitilis]|nr:hypothetical protein C8R47DRAFT_1076792 [Mycena vitilis]
MLGMSLRRPQTSSALCRDTAADAGSLPSPDKAILKPKSRENPKSRAKTQSSAPGINVQIYVSGEAINSCGGFTIDGNCNRLLREPVDQCNTGDVNGKQMRGHRTGGKRKRCRYLGRRGQEWYWARRGIWAKPGNEDSNCTTIWLRRKYTTPSFEIELNLQTYYRALHINVLLVVGQVILNYCVGLTRPSFILDLDSSCTDL